MDLKKLKKQLLQEELRRRNKFPLRYKVAGLLLLLVVVAGAATGWYYYRLDDILAGRLAAAEQLLKEQKVDQAEERFAALYREYPAAAVAPEALFRQAEVRELYQRRYREAILTFTLLEHDYPAHPLALAARERVARIYKERLHDNERAITAYQELIDAGTAAADRYSYEMADAYFRENNFEQARIEFEALVKNYPDSPLVPEAVFRIGSTHALEHQPAKAEAAYRRVIENYPDDRFALEAKMGLATVLEDRDRLRDALTILEELEGIYPHRVALEQRIEQVRERIEKKKKAI